MDDLLLGAMRTPAKTLAGLVAKVDLFIAAEVSGLDEKEEAWEWVADDLKRVEAIPVQS